MKTFNEYIAGREINNKICEAAYYIAQLGLDPVEFLLKSSKGYPEIELAILEYKNELENYLNEAPATFGQIAKGVGTQLAGWAGNKAAQWATKNSPKLYQQALSILTTLAKGSNPQQKSWFDNVLKGLQTMSQPQGQPQAEPVTAQVAQPQPQAQPQAQPWKNTVAYA